MSTKISTYVQATADVVRVVSLKPGDVYKRLNEGYGEPKMNLGIVTAVLNNGERVVADALASYAGAVILGGEAYEVAGRVVPHPRPGQLDGLVTFHISDGTRDHAIAVTLQVAATPLGGA